MEVSSSLVLYPLEKKSELDDPEEVVVWYCLGLKQSNPIRGGDTATVTAEDEWPADDSPGDSRNRNQNRIINTFC